MWRLCRHPSPPSTEGGDHPRQRMVEDILFPPRLCVSQQKGLSSVSLTADSSLCRGSLFGTVSRKASPERGGARHRRAEGFVPPTSAGHKRAPSQAEPPMQKSPSQTPAALRERGVWGERRFSQRSGLSPQSFPHPVSSGREREGGELLYREAPLPRISLIL